MNKTIASMSLFLALAVLLSACYDSDRGAGTLQGTTDDHVLAIEIRTDHGAYKFGEPVNIHAKLTNTASQVITLQNRSGKEPVLNIIFQRGPYDTPIERRDWSQEHPDQVKYTLTLAPAESYEVEWSLTPSERDVYIIVVPWADNLGYLRTSGFGMSYDVPKL
jgi:hypothetical protein